MRNTRESYDTITAHRADQLGSAGLSGRPVDRALLGVFADCAPQASARSRTWAAAPAVSRGAAYQGVSGRVDLHAEAGR